MQNNHIGKKIEQRRKEMGLHLENLAIYTDIPLRELNNMEIGEREPSQGELRQLAVVLHVDKKFFL